MIDVNSIFLKTQHANIIYLKRILFYNINKFKRVLYEKCIN